MGYSLSLMLLSVHRAQNHHQNLFWLLLFLKMSLKRRTMTAQLQLLSDQGLNSSKQ